MKPFSRIKKLEKRATKRNTKSDILPERSAKTSVQAVAKPV
jgi:hypothetical protein